MERTINFVIRGDLASGKIESEIGKNKAGETAIIFYSKQKPAGWFDQLKQNAKHLFGIVQSGTSVATKYSAELGAALPETIKDIKKEKITPSFSTQPALQIYLNAVKIGSHSITDADGIKTTVNIEVEPYLPVDDLLGRRPRTSNDLNLSAEPKSPNNASKYLPYPSLSRLRDGSEGSAPTDEKRPGTRT
jgi:hypothetical protein